MDKMKEPSCSWEWSVRRNEAILTSYMNATNDHHQTGELLKSDMSRFQSRPIANVSRAPA